LLFDVTALLITSAALGPAAGVSVAPQNTSISQVVSGSVTVGARPAVPISPSSVQHAFAVSTLQFPQAPAKDAALSGLPLLTELSDLPTGELTAFASAHAGTISRLLNNPPAARDVGAWWSSLGAQSRLSLEASTPRLVGNLDGVPVAVRNAANRTWVAQSLTSMKSGMSAIAARAVAANSQQKVHMLAQVLAALKSTKGGPERSLLSMDDAGQGKTSIVIGNLKTADYVTYLVPGMFYTVDGDVKDFTDAAAYLYTQQNLWLNRVDPVPSGETQKTVAVVAWMGYQTPDLTNIGSLNLAFKGRDALAHAIEGLDAQRAGNVPYTTIVAHSYGSTAAMLMLNQYDFSVDALAMVGSPGSSVQSVSDLNVRHGNVFVGSAAWDPVPNSAFFGNDPASKSFGAKTLGVSGGTDPITGKALDASIGHNDYFTKGTEAMRNFALIGIGRSDLVNSK
jgi:hypothetical protein